MCTFGIIEYLFAMILLNGVAGGRDVEDFEEADTINCVIRISEDKKNLMKRYLNKCLVIITKESFLQYYCFEDH